MHREHRIDAVRAEREGIALDVALVRLEAELALEALQVERIAVGGDQVGPAGASEGDQAVPLAGTDVEHPGVGADAVEAQEAGDHRQVERADGIRRVAALGHFLEVAHGEPAARCRLRIDRPGPRAPRRGNPGRPVTLAP